MVIDVNSPILSSNYFILSSCEVKDGTVIGYDDYDVQVVRNTSVKGTQDFRTTFKSYDAMSEVVLSTRCVNIEVKIKN